jgi:hypothetical protein
MSEELSVQHPVLSSVPIKCKDYLSTLFHLPKHCVEPPRLSAMQVAGDGEGGTKPIDADLLRLEQLKWEYNLAKAVKSDDAKVPIHIWDNSIFSAKATAQETQVIAWFQEKVLQKHRWKLTRDVLDFLSSKYGGMTSKLQ